MLDQILIDAIKPAAFPDSDFFNAELYLFCKKKLDYCNVYTFKKGYKNIVFLGKPAGDYISGSYLHSIVGKNAKDPNMLFTLHSIPVAMVEKTETENFWGMYQAHGQCIFGLHQSKKTDKCNDHSCRYCGADTAPPKPVLNEEYSLD